VEIFQRLDAPVDLLRSVTEVAIVVAAAVAANIGLKVALRFAMRRAVRRAWHGQGRWVPRLPRGHDGSQGGQRRLQRADAAAHMVSRLAGLVIGGLAVLLISSLLGVDPVVMVSSAGFVGAGIAVGGQAIIKDWLTGLLVLLEDRYAIGDRVTLRVGGEDVTGAVESLNGAGVRLRLDDGSTWHVGHGAVDSVTNRSQQLVSQLIDLPDGVRERLDPNDIDRALSVASHDLGLTDVVLVADVLAEGGREHGQAGLTILASRPLNRRQHDLVSHRLTELGRR
jgi:small conductance mechanosensitive channel